MKHLKKFKNLLNFTYNKKVLKIKFFTRSFSEETSIKGQGTHQNLNLNQKANYKNKQKQLRSSQKKRKKTK